MLPGIDSCVLQPEVQWLRVDILDPACCGRHNAKVLRCVSMLGASCLFLPVSSLSPAYPKAQVEGTVAGPVREVERRLAVVRSAAPAAATDHSGSIPVLRNPKSSIGDVSIGWKAKVERGAVDSSTPAEP